MSSYNRNNRIGREGMYVSSDTQNTSIFDKMLRKLTSTGIKYDDMINRNINASGRYEDPRASNQRDSDIASASQIISNRVLSKMMESKSFPYLDRAYSDKRRILREYSLKDKLKIILNIIADESIIYNDDKDFCQMKTLGADYSKETVDDMLEVFNKIYNLYGFNDGVTAYNLYKDFLIDGNLAFEIVWDDKNKNIIYFHRIEPNTIVPVYEDGIGLVWVQYPEDSQNRRILLDSQIVYVSYSSHNDFSETSYLEGLIRPYNQLEIMEQTRVMYNIIHTTIYEKFTIPVKGLSRPKQEQLIGQLIADYSEEVEFDDYLGTLTINGSKRLKFQKQLWFPEDNTGKPDLELVSPDGHDMNENDMLIWFYNNLKRASRIPFQRFDKENSGGSIHTDVTEMTRDEISFGNFINRIRETWKEILVKPIRLQLMMNNPELIDDDKFSRDLDIEFNTNQVFEKWKKLANLHKQVAIVTDLLSIERKEGIPYFHIDFLMKEYMNLTPEQIEENQAFWLKEKNNVTGSANPSGDGGDLDFSGENDGLDINIDGDSGETNTEDDFGLDNISSEPDNDTNDDEFNI